MSKKSFKSPPRKSTQNIDVSKDFMDYIDEEAESGEKKANEEGPDHEEGQSLEDDIKEDVRQTFIIGPDYLDKLKDLVYTKRKKGDYDYSQKTCLHEALDMLFAIQDEILIRPEEMKQKERSRNKSIRKALSK